MRTFIPPQWGQLFRSIFFITRFLLAYNHGMDILGDHTRQHCTGADTMYMISTAFSFFLLGFFLAYLIFVAS
jgi:hypothetical protein